jgi:phthalate 4,5-dioxygenase oxygenase subunit
MLVSLSSSWPAELRYEEFFVLTAQENELLTRVGPGTPMGELLRRFWLPALLSDEVPTPDCDPIRTRALGEDLVAFRDSAGRVGIFEAHCPHRRAPLFFGRNEECGLRCVYHGWKFDVSGKCVDMPSEPAESDFKNRVAVRSYSTYESGGVVWIYMGPAAHRPPEPPNLPFTLLPEQQRVGVKFLIESSYLQNLEGDLDTAHVSFLHSVMDDGASLQSVLRLDGYVNDRRPRLTVIGTDCGFLYGGRRLKPNGDFYWRVTQYLLPIYALIPISSGYNAGASIWMPIDDTHCWRYLVGADMPASVPPGSVQRGEYRLDDGAVIDTYLSRYTKRNLYGMDRSKRNVDYTGIPALASEDQAMNEGMGPICDRTREHLGTTDVAIIAMRRRLLRMIEDLQNGIEPFAALHPELYRVRPLDTDSPVGELSELLEQHKEDLQIPAVASGEEWPTTRG